MTRSAFAAALLLLACDASPKRGAPADTGQPIVAATDTGSKDDCPVTGLWAQCTLLYRLERSGFTVRPESLTDVREPRLAIVGRRLPIGHGEIAYFIYADTASRARDEARLDAAAFISPARETGPHDRTLLASQNLLVLMRVLNGAYRERIANAVLGGPPQPHKPSR